jgi:hypothetical protein
MFELRCRMWYNLNRKWDCGRSIAEDKRDARDREDDELGVTAHLPGRPGLPVRCHGLQVGLQNLGLHHPMQLLLCHGSQLRPFFFLLLLLLYYRLRSTAGLRLPLVCMLVSDQAQVWNGVLYK